MLPKKRLSSLERQELFASASPKKQLIMMDMFDKLASLEDRQRVKAHADIVILQARLRAARTSNSRKD
jgi:hypothetical protein